MVIAHTERVAAELAQKYPGQPRSELSAWLRVAHQREAMVTRIYGLPELRKRLPDEGEGGAATIAAKAIKGIWAQENAHTGLLGALREVDDQVLPELQELQGKLEGEVTRAGASGGLLARMLIALGVFFDVAPDFAGEIDAMTMIQFFEFCSELEDTAGRGYERMVQLAKMCASEMADENPAFQLPYDLTKIWLEERYHHGIFNCMEKWLEPGGQWFRPLSPEGCVAELHALADEYLDLAMARHVYRRTRAAGKRTDRWISHGGLDSLFGEFGLGLPVAPPDETVAALTSVKLF